MNKFVFTLLILCCAGAGQAEDGYRLWLRYDRIVNTQTLQQYRNSISSLHFFTGNNPVLTAAREELTTGLEGLLGAAIPMQPGERPPTGDEYMMIGTPSSSIAIRLLHLENELAPLGAEGFIIRSVTSDGLTSSGLTTNGRTNSGKTAIVLAANTDRGILYGVFHFLRLLQTQQSLQHLSITSTPAMTYRILDHWDNLNRTVERGYAGFSIWNWFTLPAIYGQAIHRLRSGQRLYRHQWYRIE